MSVNDMWVSFVNDMWVSFKSEVSTAIERFIPTKMTVRSNVSSENVTSFNFLLASQTCAVPEFTKIERKNIYMTCGVQYMSKQAATSNTYYNSRLNCYIFPAQSKIQNLCI